MLNFSLPLLPGARCKAIAPYLIPFSENSLPPRLHAQVARHLGQCPECRAEVQLLGQMSNFFRANPPEAALPSPNLWQSIEARIQAEPQDTPVLPLPRVPVTARAGVRGFVRGFAAAGGVVAAAVVGVAFWAESQPHIASVPTVASGASKVAAREEISLIIRPARKTSYVASATMAPAVRPLPIRARFALTRAKEGKAPLAFLASTAAPRPGALPRPVALPAMLRPGRQVVAQQEQAVEAAVGTVAHFGIQPFYARRQDPATASGVLAASTEDKTASLGVNRAQVSRDLEGAEDGGALRFDPLHRASELLDRSLSNAAVVAVAASLPAASVTIPAEESLHAYQEGTTDTSLVTKPATPDVEPASRVLAKGKQVVWLVEDAPRSARRSVSEATSDLRRQQSLFSYGVR